MKIQNIPADLTQQVTDICFSHGSTGISEELAYHQPDLTFDPRIEKAKNVSWVAYFQNEPPVELLVELKNLSPFLGILSLKEQDKDWLSEWKKNWNAFELIAPYWVVPSWIESPVKKQHTLLLDPGMAFGTGTHATTKMAAFLVRQSMQEFKPSTVLDVGTGTGILAILAEKIGSPEQIDAIDNDPESIRVSRENTARNNCKNIEVRPEAIEDLKGSYDLIVANIIDGVLLRLSPALRKRLAENGQLVLSGILLEREQMFFEAFGISDFEVLDRLQHEEWVAYRLQRPSIE